MAKRQVAKAAAGKSSRMVFNSGRDIILTLMINVRILLAAGVGTAGAAVVGVSTASANGESA